MQVMCSNQPHGPVKSPQQKPTDDWLTSLICKLGFGMHQVKNH